jgi:RNA polymerase sigma factor (sigma-70 family)
VETNTGSATDEDSVGRFVMLAVLWATDGTLDRETLERLLEEVNLPARSYRDAMSSLADSGITVVSWAEDVDDGAEDTSGIPIDGFGAFIRRSEHPVLTFEQEQELGSRIDRGRVAAQALSQHHTLDDLSVSRFTRWVRDGREAENDLVRHNLRLVISIAKLLSPFGTPALDFEDLIQEGWTGLAHAVEKWDYRRGLKFSTYATWWIRQSMSRAIADRGSTVRLPVHSRDDLKQLLRVEAALSQEGRRPTPSVLAGATGLPESKVRHLLSWRSKLESIDRLADLGVILPAATFDEPADRAELAIMMNEVDAVVAHLPEREAEILRRRFGLEGRLPETLEQIGRDLGLTRERVRQLESKGLRKLARDAAGLRDFVEKA